MVFGFMAAGEREHMTDAVDQAILRRLQRDGRQTNRELAEALGIAPSTALERTRALRARGVITGFHAAGCGEPSARPRSWRILPPTRSRSAAPGSCLAGSC
jgi:predicted ArsR family transcriptional regulator